MNVAEKMKVMDQKRQKQISIKEKSSKKGALTFFSDVKSELKRITWTSKEELRLYSKIVVITTFALGMAVYASDLLIQGILNGLNVVFRMILG